MIAINRILTPTDFSDFSKHALKYAVSFATQYKAKLYLLHVISDIPEISTFYLKHFPMEGISEEEIYGEIEERVRSELERIISEDIGEGIEVEPAVVRGVPFLEIIRFARENLIDLIVIATHGRTGLKRALFGSTAEKVVRKAPCPVMTVRHPEHEFVLP